MIQTIAIFLTACFVLCATEPLGQFVISQFNDEACVRACNEGCEEISSTLQSDFPEFKTDVRACIIPCCNQNCICFFSDLPSLQHELFPSQRQYAISAVGITSREEFEHWHPPQKS